jgi:hypothetical protein
MVLSGELLGFRGQEAQCCERGGNIFQEAHRERLYIMSVMDLFPIAKTSWSPGDTREVEQSRVQREIGMEYDSYRRVYIADGHEWRIAGQIAREDGKKYYILECVE